MYFSYFNSRYRIIPKWEGPDWYKTSTSLLIGPARWISITIGQDRIFDIRILAAIYILIFLLGLWLILAGSRSLPTSLRVTVWGLLILIFTDVGYIAYFNSFYSEATALSFLAVGVGSSLPLLANRSSSVWLLIAYFLAIAVVVAAKPMYVPLAPAFGLFGLYLSGYARHSWRYWLSSGLAAALCLMAFWAYSQAPQSMRVDGAYIGVFMDLLPTSSIPEQDLAELGLSPKYASFSGTTPYQPDSPLKKDPEFRKEFSTRVNSLTIPVFYLTHPARLYQLSERCMKHAFSTRVQRLGYYESASGKPPLSRPFGIWSTVRENLFPRSVLFLCFFLATGIAATVLLVRASLPALRGLYLLYLLFIYIAGAQFLVAIVGGGGEPDVEKHLFMFNIAFDACMILFVLWAAYMLKTRGRASRSRSAQPFLHASGTGSAPLERRAASASTRKRCLHSQYGVAGLGP